MLDQSLFQVTIIASRSCRQTDAWVGAREGVELVRVAEEHVVALVVDEQCPVLLLEAQAHMVRDPLHELVQDPQSLECCLVPIEQVLRREDKVDHLIFRYGQ